MYALPEQIEQISVQYTDSTQYSFILKQDQNRQINVQGNQVPEMPLNIKRATSYLKLWDSIYCLGYENRNRIKDTIFTQGKQLAVVTLTCKEKPVQTLELFFKPVTKGTKGFLKLDGQSYDFDVFIGWLNRKEMIVITRAFAQIMLRSFPEFFEPEQNTDTLMIENRKN